MITVYALKSLLKNYIYVGQTNDINRRFKEHNEGLEKTTRSYSPYIIIYEEVFENRKKARIKEKYLKSGIGKEFLKRII